MSVFGFADGSRVPFAVRVLVWGGDDRQGRDGIVRLEFR